MHVIGYLLKAKDCPPISPMNPNIELLLWKSQVEKPTYVLFVGLPNGLDSGTITIHQ